MPATLNRRQATRYVISFPITLEEQDAAGREGMDRPAQTVDVSRQGVGIRSQRRLAEGTELGIVFDVLPGRPRLYGVVRYCRPLDEEAHHVGLQFEFAHTAAEARYVNVRCGAEPAEIL